MPVILDPEEYEVKALYNLVDFHKKNVLEIGCGDGRLTWRYAQHASDVIGIDPVEEDIALARKDTPEYLRYRVSFACIAFEDYAAHYGADIFDSIILSWSL